MNALQELSDLRRQWHTQPQPGPDASSLRRRVAADTRAHARLVAWIAVATVVFIGAMCAYAFITGEPQAWFGVMVTALFACVVWLVALCLARGTWRPRDESTTAYLEVSIRRCRSIILAAPIGILLYVAGLVGTLIWKQRLFGIEWSQLLESPSVIISGWIGAPAYALGMLWNARRQQRQLTFLQELRRQLGDG